MFSNRFVGFAIAVGALVGVNFLIGTFHSIDDAKHEIWRKTFIAELEVANAAVSVQEAPKIQIGPVNVYPISLNYTPNFDRLIKDGEYVYVNHRINTENFDIDHFAPMMAKFQFVHFNKAMSWMNTIFALADKGLRAANLKELMIFRANYPDQTFKMPIVAPGSMMWHPYGWFAMPYIQYVDGQANLDLTYGDSYDPCTMVAALPIGQ